MSDIHTIRLRQAWHYRQDDNHACIFERYFNKPTGLQPNSEVWLCVTALPLGAKISLNQQLLGTLAEPSAKYLISPALTLRNQIHIVHPINPNEPSPPMPEQVWLEIRENSEE